MNIGELKFIKYDEDGYRIYNCPICGGLVKVHESVFFGKCDSCGATIIDYKPLPHQIKFHQSKAKFKLQIGGYGSGKTTADAAEIAAHIFSVPNGRTLITAQTLQQVKEAVLPELEKFFPPWFYSRKPVKTPQPKYYFKNGHEVVVYASDDDQKIRSLNVTAFWIVEASGVDYSIFTELTARIRNPAAVIKDKTGKEIEHRFLGLVESNPEEGWIRDEFLLRSNKIFASESVDIESYEKIKVKKPEESYHSFLSSSRDNKFLHSSFIKDLCVGKSDRWIKKYIYCHLEVKEGTVYPEYTSCIVDPFDIPKNWIRIFGFDKGWADETCLACGAIDTTNGICYIYDEYYMSQQPITFHARRIREKVLGLNLYKNIQADPSVRNKNERDGVSYKDYFYNVSDGIVLEEGNNSLFSGIERVRDFMYIGKLKFFSSCVNMKEEAQNYCYKKDKDGTTKDDPVDRRNHLMDALRYLVMALPDDIRTCNISNQYSSDLSQRIEKMQSNNEKIKLEEGEGGIYGFGRFEY